MNYSITLGNRPIKGLLKLNPNSVCMLGILPAVAQMSAVRGDVEDDA